MSASTQGKKAPGGAVDHASGEPLLSVEHLVKEFRLPGKAFGQKAFRAVDDVSFSIGAGEVYGLVGESGSGKSTTGRLICGLERPDAGRIAFRGQDLAAMGERDRRAHRREIQLVFQDSSTAFDPRWRVGAMLEESLLIAGVTDAVERRERAREALAQVGLREGHYDAFPHELSGGQRQRLNLARALIARPRLVVCDEPVSALDVSVQAQVLNLLKDLQRQTGVAMLFITHDIRVVRFMADRIGVLRRGRLVEEGAPDQIIGNPREEYTRRLIEAVPKG